MDKRAFDYWVSLGSDRTHEAVADRYGVSVRTVQRRARDEDWTSRLQFVSKAEREGSTEIKDPDALLNALDRQQRFFRDLQVAARKYLKAEGFKSGAEALRALDIGARAERELLKVPPHRDVELTQAEREKADREELVGDDEDGWGDEEDATGAAP